MNKNKDQGFTLIELLIVIVILGILAAITVFAVNGITDQAQETSCDIEGRNIRTAVEAMTIANNGVYPDDMTPASGYAADSNSFDDYYDVEDLPTPADAALPLGNLDTRWDYAPNAAGDDFTLSGEGNCAGTTIR